MKKLLFFTLLASTYATTVCAEDSWYIGAFYNTQEISPVRDFNSAGFIAGYQYNEYFALETRFAAGTSGYSGSYGGTKPEGSYKEDIDTQASLLIKASYPLFDSFKVYGLAGYSNTKLEINGLGQDKGSVGTITDDLPFKRSESESGFSYGFGLDYQINAQLKVFVDYQILPDFEPNSSFSRSWKSTTIGVNYSF
ncbi:porin family protein [Thalassotalea hakodatensis]|uniref:porin family protein n=1 Tax=Thalassotalea hakodatensis TaxID=3030492 RepID=UPI0025737032|nr:porin family protein [Thalassotalea hakodatensis]